MRVISRIFGGLLVAVTILFAGVSSSFAVPSIPKTEGACRANGWTWVEENEGKYCCWVYFNDGKESICINPDTVESLGLGGCDSEAYYIDPSGQPMCCPSETGNGETHQCECGSGNVFDTFSGECVKFGIQTSSICGKWSAGYFYNYLAKPQSPNGLEDYGSSATCSAVMSRIQQQGMGAEMLVADPQGCTCACRDGLTFNPAAAEECAAKGSDCDQICVDPYKGDNDCPLGQRYYWVNDEWTCCVFYDPVKGKCLDDQGWVAYVNETLGFKSGGGYINAEGLPVECPKDEEIGVNADTGQCTCEKGGWFDTTTGTCLQQLNIKAHEGFATPIRQYISSHSYGVPAVPSPNGFLDRNATTVYGQDGAYIYTSMPVNVPADTPYVATDPWDVGYVNAYAKVTITLDKNGGSTNQTLSYRLQDPNPLYPSTTYNNVTKTGYTFAGWWTAANGGTQVNTSSNALPIDNDVIYYAHWTPNTYTVTLDKNANDATAGTASVTATYDAAMPTTSITMPTRSGYNFLGYYDTDASTGGTQYYDQYGASSHVWDKTSNTILYARWEGNAVQNHTITLNYGLGVSNSTNTTGAIYVYDSHYYLNSGHTQQMTTSSNGITIPQRTDYTFAGYKATCGGQYITIIGSNGKITSDALSCIASVTSDMTASAEWTYSGTTGTYYLDYYYGGTSWRQYSNNTNMTVYDRDDAYFGGAIPAVSANGYFAGWCAHQYSYVAGGEVYDGTDTGRDLYPKWCQTSNANPNVTVWGPSVAEILSMGAANSEAAARVLLCNNNAGAVKCDTGYKMQADNDGHIIGNYVLNGEVVRLWDSCAEGGALTNCSACTNKPANSHYTASAGTVGGNCPWECDPGYNKVGNTCVQRTCIGITLNNTQNGGANAGGTTTLYKYANETGWYSDSTCQTSVSTLPEIPYKSAEYRYSGHYDSASGGTGYISYEGVLDTSWAPSSATTLYAQFDQPCLHIRIDPQGNSAGTSNGEGLSVYPQNLYKKYGTTAWYTDSNCTTVATSPVTITASKAHASFAGIYDCPNGTLCATGGTNIIASDGTLSTTWTTTTGGWVYPQYDCNAGWQAAGTRISGTCTNTSTANCYGIALNNTSRGGTGGLSSLYMYYDSSNNAKHCHVYTNADCTGSITSADYPSKTNAQFSGYYYGSYEVIDDQGDADTLFYMCRDGWINTSVLQGGMTFHAHYVCDSGYCDNCTDLNPDIAGACVAATQSYISFNQSNGTGGQVTSLLATYGVTVPALTTAALPTATASSTYSDGVNDYSCVQGGYNICACTGYKDSNGSMYYYNGANNRIWDKKVDTTLYANYNSCSGYIGYGCGAGSLDGEWRSYTGNDASITVLNATAANCNAPSGSSGLAFWLAPNETDKFYPGTYNRGTTEYGRIINSFCSSNSGLAKGCWNFGITYDLNVASGVTATAATNTNVYPETYNDCEGATIGGTNAADKPTRTDGYVFAGWCDDADGTQNCEMTRTIPSNSVTAKTFYAKWSADSIQCQAGTYLPANSGTCSSCLAGYYCAGGTYTASSSDQGLSSCTGTSRYSGAGASACSTVSDGYYTTGCDGNGNKCTGQSQCTGATYCSDGVQSNCPPGYNYDTTPGKTSASQCTILCSAGERVATEQGQCVSNVGSGWLTMGSLLRPISYGAISPVAYCGQETTTSGTASTNHDELRDCASNLPAGYTVLSDAMSGVTGIEIYSNAQALKIIELVASSNADGKIDSTHPNLLNSGNVATGAGVTNPGYATNGNYLDNNYTTIQRDASAVWNNLGHNGSGINGLKSLRIIMAPENNLSTYNNVDIYLWFKDVKLLVFRGDLSAHKALPLMGGEVIITGGRRDTICGSGTARTAGKVDLGSTAACTNVNAGYYATCGGTTLTPTANGAGDGTNGCLNSCSCGLINAGRYGSAGATSATGTGAVSAGYYSTGGGTSATPTGNGNGCVGTGTTCGLVNAGRYSTGGATSAQGNGAITAGYYGSAGATSATGDGACAIGSYSAAGSSSCTACSAGTTTSDTGSTSSAACSACSNASNVSAWLSPSWSANSVSDLCVIDTCSSGYSKTGNSPYTCEAGVYAISLDSAYYTSASATTATVVDTDASPATIYEKYGDGWYTTNAAATAFSELSTLPAYGNRLFNGFWTGKTGTGTQIIDANGSIVSNTASTFTSASTAYAKWSAADACTCTTGSNVSSCNSTGVSGNKCQYTYSCAAGYTNSGGESSGTFEGAVGVSSNTSPDCGTANTYTVTFNKNANDAVAGTASVTVTYGADMPTPITLPTRTGYTFTGYYYGASSGNQYYTATGESRRKWDKTQNRTLYAHWTPNIYTVKFDKNTNDTGSTAGTSYTTATYGADMPTSNINLLNASTTIISHKGAASSGEYPAQNSNSGYYNVFFRVKPNTSYTISATTYGNRQGIFEYTSIVDPNAYTATDQLAPDRINNAAGNSGFSGTRTFTTGNTTQMVMLYLGINNVEPTGLQIYPTNEPIGTITLPTRPNYSFAGYYDASNPSTQYYSNNNGALASVQTWNKTSDATLYADWSLDDVTVTLNTNGATGGSCNASVMCTPGASCTLPSWDSTSCNIYKGSNIFVGWATTNNASTGTTSITGPNSATIYYAVWKAPTCSVDNGTGVAQNTTDNAPQCQVTCDSGYHTSGTYSGTEGSTSYSYTCAANTYYVHFNNNCPGTGDGSMEDQTLTYDTSTALTSNGFTCTGGTGYTFLGWATSLENSNAGTVAHQDGASVSTLTTTNGGTVDLYAVWSQTGRTVTLNKNGGTGTCAGATSTTSATMSCSGSCTLPAWNDTLCEIANGEKVFVGWSTTEPTQANSYLDNDNTTVVTGSISPSGDVTYYAVWRTPTCTASNASSYALQNTEYNQPKCLAQCNLGYGSNRGNTYTGDTYTGNAGALTVNATCSVIDARIYYNKNGGSGTNYGGLDLWTYGSTGVVRPYNYSGHVFTAPTNGTFLNWKCLEGVLDDSDDTYHGTSGYAACGTFDAGTASVSEVNDALLSTSIDKFTLFACWQFGINFKDDDGTTDLDVNTYKYNNCEATTINYAPTKTGYTFQGWCTTNSANCEATMNPSISAGSTGTKTYYAKWTPNTYIITVNLNGGHQSGNANTTEYTFKEVYGVKWTNDRNATIQSIPGAVRDNYTFAGYYDAATDGNLVLANGILPAEATTFTGDTTIYAHWTPNNYNISYTLNGGSTAPAGYEPVDYIESYRYNGILSYFDTPTHFAFNKDFRVVGSFSNPNINNSRKILLGSYADSGKVLNLALWDNGVFRTYFDSNYSANSVSPIAPNTWTSYNMYYDPTVHKSRTHVGNQKYDTNAPNISSTVSTPMRMFLDHRNNPSSYLNPVKMGATAIYQDNALVNYYIPVRHTSTGECGMYDLKNNAFKASDTATKFNCPAYKNMPTGYTYGVGANVSVVPVREHSIFQGWCTTNSTDCTPTMAPAINTSASGDKAYYAKWDCESGYHKAENTVDAACVANTIALNWISARGTAPSTPASCTYGGTFTAPAAITGVTGYTFGGWRVSGNTFAAGATISCSEISLGVVSGTADISAQWNAHTYTVAFDTNGASGAPSVNSVTCTYGQNCPAFASQGTMSSGSDNFGGWNTASDYSGTTYNAGATPSNLTSTNGATITMYAIWTPTIVACTAGYYLPTGGASAEDCVLCTENNYCPGGSNFTPNSNSDQGLNACPSGLTTPDNNITAYHDDAGDCGRILHVGTYEVRLKSVVSGVDVPSPALRFDYDNDGTADFYARMSSTASPMRVTSTQEISSSPAKNFKTTYNSTTYYVCDDGTCN